MTPIQLDGPAKRERSWDWLQMLAGACIGIGVVAALAAFTAPATRVELAPPRVERVWTLHVKGDGDAKRMECREVRP